MYGGSRSMSKSQQACHSQSCVNTMYCAPRIIHVTSATLLMNTARSCTSLIAPSVSHHLTRSIYSHLNGKQDNQEKDYEH